MFPLFVTVSFALLRYHPYLFDGRNIASRYSVASKSARENSAGIPMFLSDCSIRTDNSYQRLVEDHKEILPAAPSKSKACGGARTVQKAPIAIVERRLVPRHRNVLPSVCRVIERTGLIFEIEHDQDPVRFSSQSTFAGSYAVSSRRLAKACHSPGADRERVRRPRRVRRIETSVSYPVR